MGLLSTKILGAFLISPTFAAFIISLSHFLFCQVVIMFYFSFLKPTFVGSSKTVGKIVYELKLRII